MANNRRRSPNRKPRRVFRWRHTVGFNSKELDVNKVGAALEQLSKENGGITPELLVERSKSPDFATHKAFTWDINEAANERWLSQARSLIKSVYVIEGDQIEPVFFHVRVEEEKSYQRTRVVVKNLDMIRSVRAELTSKLDSAKRSLDEFESLCNRDGNAAQMKQVHRIRQPLEKAIAAARA